MTADTEVAKRYRCCTCGRYLSDDDFDDAPDNTLRDYNASECKHCKSLARRLRRGKVENGSCPVCETNRMIPLFDNTYPFKQIGQICGWCAAEFPKGE
ncbi:MAG: hypothetical protein ACYS1A_20015 [Planctomycetota bacterium]|jgi:DNA-directed RNA polymerase subunit RPC12/RpoP